MEGRKPLADREKVLESQKIISHILSLSSLDLDLEQALEEIVDSLVRIPWLPDTRVCAIFLEEEEGVLRLAAHRGMPGRILETCRRINKGECLCGLTYEAGKILFVNRMDERHTVRFHDAEDHGHYCLPLKTNGKTFGVINLYLEKDHPYDPVEEAMLLSTASAVAGVINHITLREKERRFSIAISQVPDWVVITDREGIVQYANSAVEAITGYSVREIVGKKPNLWKSGLHEEQFFQKLWSTILSGKPFRAVFINRKKSGELFYLDQTITPIKDNEGKIKGFIATGKDITESRQYQEDLYRLTHFDPLTGLPNRTSFIKEGRGIISTCRGRKFSLVLIDIDQFRFINDFYGPKVGDELLLQLSRTLQNELGSGALISRIGSDEFGILLEGPGSESRTAVICRRILRVLSQRMEVLGKQISITACAGASIYPVHSRGIEGLLRCAELALADAKERGKNNFVIFSTELNERARQKVKITKEILTSTIGKDFELRYQPIVDNSRKIVASEVLTRWKSGWISPRNFIPVLEDTGKIDDHTLWVVEETLKIIDSFRKESGFTVSISVNISPLNLSSGRFLNKLKAMLRDAGVPDGSLIFEITENLFLTQDEEILARLKEIRDMGVSLAVDDFGAGHASLLYIRSFPIDFVKLDSFLIRDMEKDVKSKSLVESLIGGMKKMGKLTVAEGVERKAQYEILKRFGCDFCQGFYFHRPMKRGDFLRLLRNL